jgi:hypothetical protein
MVVEEGDMAVQLTSGIRIIVYDSFQHPVSSVPVASDGIP